MGLAPVGVRFPPPAPKNQAFTQRTCHFLFVNPNQHPSPVPEIFRRMIIDVIVRKLYPRYSDGSPMNPGDELEVTSRGSARDDSKTQTEASGSTNRKMCTDVCPFSGPLKIFLTLIFFSVTREVRKKVPQRSLPKGHNGDLGGERRWVAGWFLPVNDGLASAAAPHQVQFLHPLPFVRCYTLPRA